MPEKKDNHCTLRFICLEHDNDSNCVFYTKEKKEIKGLKYNKCKYEFYGECINSDAQKEAIKERL